MDRDAKLAAARKKLKQFKLKKALKKSVLSDGNSESSSTTEDTPTTTQNHTEDTLEIKKSEDFIDETFELLQCANQERLSESTAATTESILQVSAKLNGIAAEADMFIDDASNHSSEEKFQMIEHPKSDEPEQHDSILSSLEVRNQALASKLSSFSQENETLRGQCRHMSDQLQLLQKEIEENSKSENNKSGNDDTFQENLQVQMQTIGVLVSEKQDLHQELLLLRSELHNRNLQQEKSREDMQSVNEKLVSCERDLQSKINALHQLKRSNDHLQSQNVDCIQELSNLKQMLENENMQSVELHGKLQTKEVEFQELYTLHAELKDRFEMADVLLQQMSANSSVEDASHLPDLQQENESLKTRFHDYQLAFQQLSAEREQLSTQYSDAQNKWENDLQNLQLKVVSLENEKQELSQHCLKLQTSIENENYHIEANDNEKMEVVELPIRDANLTFEKELEKAATTQHVLREEIAAQQSNNNHLSHLVQEKELRIYELEDALVQVKSSIKDHEQLLDGARSDKVTISRALLQNKQLKEQLEEIQDGFVRMSNDKMDLATQVSSLEHANNDLQACLNQNVALHQQMKQEVKSCRSEMQHLHEKSMLLQERIDTMESPQYIDGAEVVKTLQAESMEHIVEQLQKENDTLREKFKSPTGIETPMSDVNVVDVVFPPKLTENISIESPQIDKQPNEQLTPNATEQNPSELECYVNLFSADHVDNKETQPNALLQKKFTLIMKEKVDLLNRLELLEHTNTQLQNECDTIGEYIALYHNQRQILKQRHKEKDKYISTIIQERETMQGKVEQLQTLIVAMLNNRRDDIDFTTSTPQLDGSMTMDESDMTKRPVFQQEEPASVSRTDMLTVEKGDSETPSHNAFPGHMNKVNDTPESPGPKSATATQILTLLEQMQKPIDPGISNKANMPSGFCMHYIGPYTAI